MHLFLLTFACSFSLFAPACVPKAAVCWSCLQHHMSHRPLNPKPYCCLLSPCLYAYIYICHSGAGLGGVDSAAGQEDADHSSRGKQGDQKNMIPRKFLLFLCISTALISEAPFFAYFCLLFLSLCPCLCAQGCCLLVMPSTAHHTT